MNDLEGNIRQFVDDFFVYLIDRNQCTTYDSDTYSDCIKSVDFGDNFYLRFLSEWSEKQFYLIIFKNKSYLLELFLCRILFNNNGTITWYLDTPSRKENVKVYKDENITLREIPGEQVESIRKQQEKLHSGRKFYRVNQGYLIAQNISRRDVFERLESVIFSVIGENTTNTDLEKGAIEGIAKEITTVRRSRTRVFIEPVKARDGYRCQACGLSLFVEGKDILQVHHLNPLAELVRTTMDDLISLCPNCHVIAHKRSQPYTLNEIKKIIKNKK